LTRLGDWGGGGVGHSGLEFPNGNMITFLNGTTTATLKVQAGWSAGMHPITFNLTGTNSVPFIQPSSSSITIVWAVYASVPIASSVPDTPYEIQFTMLPLLGPVDPAIVINLSSPDGAFSFGSTTFTFRSIDQGPFTIPVTPLTGTSSGTYSIVLTSTSSYVNLPTLSYIVRSKSKAIRSSFLRVRRLTNVFWS
jgi:hypothetical protein